MPGPAFKLSWNSTLVSRFVGNYLDFCTLGSNPLIWNTDLWLLGSVCGFCNQRANIAVH